MNFTQNGNFEIHELCLKKGIFIFKKNIVCLNLTKSTTIVDLNSYIEYGKIYDFEIQIKKFWCDESKYVTRKYNIELKAGDYKIIF